MFGTAGPTVLVRIPQILRKASACSTTITAFQSCSHQHPSPETSIFRWLDVKGCCRRASHQTVTTKTSRVEWKLEHDSSPPGQLYHRTQALCQAGSEDSKGETGDNVFPRESTWQICGPGPVTEGTTVPLDEAAACWRFCHTGI